MLVIGNWPISAKANTIEVLWFPNDLHIEIRHEEKLFKSFWRHQYDKRPYQTKLRGAHQGRISMVRFILKLTEEEYHSVLDYLDKVDGKLSWAVCSQGVAQIINRNSSIFIPWFADLTPALLASYLTLLHALGHEKIESIETETDQYASFIIPVIPAIEGAFVTGAIYIAFLAIQSTFVPYLHQNLNLVRTPLNQLISPK